LSYILSISNANFIKNNYLIKEVGLNQLTNAFS